MGLASMAGIIRPSKRKPQLALRPGDGGWQRFFADITHELSSAQTISVATEAIDQ
jgi:hypothetical protein